MPDGNGISGLAMPPQVITGDSVSRLWAKFCNRPFDSGPLAGRRVGSCLCTHFSYWVFPDDGHSYVARASSQKRYPMDSMVGTTHGDYPLFINRHYRLLGAAIPDIKNTSYNQG
jgi:hypothetical protein